jgi:GDPmannose 4,6-dehydratase
MEINYLAVKGLLKAVFSDSRNEALRFYQASSSEMFGLALENPQSESTTFNPVSPYAESKVKAHIESENFRKSGFFVSSGILFNHESTFRSERFISRKISSSVARISQGLQSQLVVGNVEARRDWGAARDYVDAMNRILEHTKPDVYVVATGKLHSVKEMITLALQRVGLHERFDELVSFDENLLRPTEVMEICGNSSKIQSELGWSAKTDLKTLIHEMVDYDLGTIHGAS